MHKLSSRLLLNSLATSDCPSTPPPAQGGGLERQTNMKHSISPYPPNVRVSQPGHVFRSGQYLGYVDKVQNWGHDHLARSERGLPNKFFRTRTEAVNYLLTAE